MLRVRRASARQAVELTEVGTQPGRVVEDFHSVEVALLGQAGQKRLRGLHRLFVAGRIDNALVVFGFEDHHPPALARAVAIAAARGLGNGFQRRQGPIDDREVEIDPCLDALGGHERHGLAGLQPLIDFAQHLRAMGRTHVGGKMQHVVRAVFLQQSGQLRGMALEVHNAKPLLLGGQLAGQLFQSHRLLVTPLNLYTDGRGLVERRWIGRDLARLPAWAGELAHALVEGLELRLGGRGKQHRRAVRSAGFGQARERGQCGDGQLDRQGLHFVKEDHAAGQPVQLAAARRPCGHERLKELHAGGKHHRRVPVFGKQARQGGGVIVAALGRRSVGIFDEAVVLQYGQRMETFLAREGEDLPVDARRLVDDIQERHDQHDPPQPVLPRVMEGKRQHGQRLAGAGGSRERKEARRLLRRFQAALEELLANGCHG